MKVVGVSIITWPKYPDRVIALMLTLARLKRYLYANRHGIYWAIATETEDVSGSTMSMLRLFCKREGFVLSEGYGAADLGANMNNGLKALKSCDYRLLIQDDMMLDRPLNLSPHIDAMEKFPDIDAIRFTWGDQSFSDVYDKLSNYHVVHMGGVWPFDDKPALRRSIQDDRLPYYTEGLPFPQSEFEMCKTVKKLNAKILAAEHRYFRCDWARSTQGRTENSYDFACR